MCSFLFCNVCCFNDVVYNTTPAVTPSANVSAFVETRNWERKNNQNEKGFSSPSIRYLCLDRWQSLYTLFATLTKNLINLNKKFLINLINKNKKFLVKLERIDLASSESSSFWQSKKRFHVIFSSPVLVFCMTQGFSNDSAHLSFGN